MQNFGPGYNIQKSHDREKVMIYISCKGLKNKDVMSKSDPQAFLSLKNGKKATWLNVGQTEQIKDNLNPDFTTSIEVDFIFEVRQELRVEIFDIDSSTSKESLGVAETELGKLVGSRQNMIILDVMIKNKQAGKVILRLEKISQRQNDYQFKLSGKNLKRFSMFGTIDPFLRFYKPQLTQEQMKVVETGDFDAQKFCKGITNWVITHQTEHYDGQENPSFNSFQAPSQKFTSNNVRLPIKCMLMHYHSNGSHKYKGETFFTIDQIKNKNQRSFNFWNTEKGKDAGTLIIQNFNESEHYPFTAYLQGGLNISLVCCVDFTGSNGPVNKPSSLHYCNPQSGLNQYQKAILAVGDILLNYDYDKMVATYGFGGLPKGYPDTSHFFPLNLNSQQPEVYHTKGIFDAYNYALSNVQLSGPTYFGEITENVVNYTINNFKQHPDNYTVLLILTDGYIHDMNKTVENLVKGADYPLSVIIIGIGDEDFEQMETLDGDGKKLKTQEGKSASRDIVQFVPFNQCNKDPETLGMHVLKELPQQAVSFYKTIGRKPNAPVQADLGAVLVEQNLS